MRPIFYENLINVSSLMEQICQDLHHLEQEEIHEILEEILHHRVLAVILDQLPPAHHENFLLRFQANPNDLDLVSFLKDHSPNIEEKITEVSLITIEEIKLDLLKATKQ